MSKKAAIAATALLGATLVLSGCESVDPQAVSNAGLSPVTTADATLTCYDYSGNVSLKEKPDNGVSEYTGYTQANYKSGKPTIVMGGGGCITDTYNFNVKDEASIAKFKGIEDSAPYSAVVTNGVDKVLLSGRFTDVSAYGESGYTTLTLETNHTTLHKVVVKGLQVIATAHQEGIPDYIRNAEQAPVAP